MKKLYIGTYTEDLDTPKKTGSSGIYICQCPADLSKVLWISDAFAGVNPSYLAIGERVLYTANEKNGFGKVSALRMTDDEKGLVLLNEREIPNASATCQISLGVGNRTIYAANYDSGSIAAIPIAEDGSLLEPFCIIQHTGCGPVKGRQNSAHAHSVNPDPSGKFLIAADLGKDSLILYDIQQNSGGITPHKPCSDLVLAGGQGARSLAYHPNGKWFYLSAEISGKILVFRFDPKSGHMDQMQEISTLPECYQGENLVYHVEVSRRGDYVFAANRIHDSIVAYHVDREMGMLRFSDRTTSGGKWPRHFALTQRDDDDCLIVANHLSDNVTAIPFDPRTGKFGKPCWKISIPAPAYVGLK